ncbi:DsbA family protein [Legionella impletisoli]|uniref:Thioredoxin domain-containing protein n=1 Tax=Legionella impletisoli TaxID=343510 RepID=A0A917JNQ1_9GAMM|nr:DsbA family protein [Legionella impletisoli]GGI79129.1 hypothetical protein GCM10007966_04520 [Legionella impletisoli]
MKLKSLMTVGLLASLATGPVIAAEALTAAQKKEVEQIIHDYLVKNPEVLVEVSQALQQKQQQSMQEKAKGAISENAKQLFTEDLAVAGNPNGSVTLVEFFDYQCIHCKKMKSVISDLIKKNENLRVIYKEFPIFGKNSELASKAALAAAMQGKYKAMHDALLAENKRLDEAVIMDAAKSAGLDVDKLKKDMDSKKVKEALEANRELAERMNLMGTPAFIVAATPKGEFKKNSDPAFIPGAASEEVLQNLIEQTGK